VTRSPVTLREAKVDDALFLVELWHESLRRADRQDLVADLEIVIKSAAASPEQRLVVAECDGAPVGAVFLRATTMSPINLEPVVQTLSPHVLPSARRKGVGRALMEEAVTFADELGVGHVMTAASSTSRDGNRFLARVGFGAHATLRVAATPMLRGKLTARMTAGQRAVANRGHLGQVLAARRSVRSARGTATSA
jgi:GNAT superfamily N-acetyltransferase